MIYKMKKNTFFVVILILILLQACTPKYKYKENAVPEAIKPSKRLDILFLKTKIVCFGRYALEVPQETEFISGSVSLPSDIEIIKGGVAARDERIAEDVEKIKLNDTSEIPYDKEGPIKDSWQIRYFNSSSAKEGGLFFFDTYVNKGDLTFIIGGSLNEGGTEEKAANIQMVRAKSLRLRDNDEVPTESGNCIPHGFMSDNQYDEQEIVNAGLYFPSFPDVTFSMTSNKDAYGDYAPEEFEKRLRGELSLLARINQAKEQQGNNYPSRTLLREGKRDVQHWHGEESLIRRTDGVHDFEWSLVGKPRDVANPSVLEVVMFTKVEHNTVGAADAASLSDDEAVALWDKLLSGLKFRVKVPGAPPGSYYIDPDNPVAPPAS